MPKALPKLPYFTLSELAKVWECSEEDILHRGIAGHLKICALGNYWTLQEGYFSDDAPEGFPVPTKERGSGIEPLLLTRPALREILSFGEVADPEFVFEENGKPDQGKDGEKFDRFLSSVVISTSRENTRSKIVVRKSELVIRKEDVEAFLTTNNDLIASEPKTYDLSTMKKNDRDVLVLEYAVRVWEKYQKETGNPPRIGYVHDQIQQNKNFARTGKDKSGECKPNYKTIVKEITETRILKAIQSRKSAEKRA